MSLLRQLFAYLISSIGVILAMLGFALFALANWIAGDD